MQDLASLKATLEQAQAAVNGLGYGSVAGGRGTDLRNALGRAQSAYNSAAMANRPGTGAIGGGMGTPESNWANALKNTEGRGNAVMSDPYTQAALDRFKGVLGGQDVPFTQQVQSQLLSRQADAGASALGAQREMLAEQMGALGGSMADPSAQAAMRRLMAANQASNNANLGDIQTKATLTNFGAKNDAAGSLAATRASQLGMANGQFNQASQMYANQQFAGQHQNAAPMGYSSQAIHYAPPQYSPQGNGTAPRPAPKPTGPAINSTGGVGTQQYGPAKPKPQMQIGAYTNRPSGAPAQPSYSGGVNTATNVPYGTGWVQMAGQPQTRLNYQSSLYNPNKPVY